MRTAVIDEQIISALVIALARNPRASLQDLADAVRIGKTTLYRFAKTRDDLIDKLRDRCVTAVSEATSAAALDSLPVEEAFRKLVEHHLAHKESCAFLVSYWRTPKSSPGIQGDEKWQKYEQTLEAFFLRGQREGLFKLGPTAVCLMDMFGYIVAGLAESALSGRIASHGLEAVATDMFLNGLKA